MVQTKKLMVPARLRAAAKFALTVALGCAHILKPILDHVAGISPRSPVLDAAVAVVLVVLPLTYLMGVVLLYIHMMTPPTAPPGASSRLAAVAWTLASALLVALVAFLLLLVLGASPATSSGGGGFTPT